MKKLPFLFLYVAALGGCQKRGYPTYDRPNSLIYLHQKQSVREYPTPEKLPYSTEAGTLPEELKKTKSVATGYVSANVIYKKKIVTPTPVGKGKIEKRQPTNLVPISHQKTDKPTANKTKNLGELSLVLGLIGIFAILSPMVLSAPIGLFIAGCVVGTIGMVVGFVSFSQIKKQRIASPSETAAIIGTALGIVTFLAGIMVSLVYLIITSSSGF